MPIEVRHGRPETLVAAAKRAGEAQAALREQEKAERLQAQQMEFDYRTALRQQDMVIDLQMNERAKLWEIEKMELRSRMDFEREEQLRRRKLDSLDSAIQQIDKEMQAGRITEQQAYPLKQKLELNKLGVNVPVSAFPADDEEERYGVRPYWMRGRDAPEGTPERQLYEAKMAEQISGERRGVVPYYLDPTFIGNYPEAARQAQEARGIFLSDEEFDALRERPGIERPTIPEVPIAEDRRVRVISPTGQTGTILENELQEYINQGFTIIKRPVEGGIFGGAGVTDGWEEPVVETPATKRRKIRKPTVGTIDWDYIMSKGFK